MGRGGERWGDVAEEVDRRVSQESQESQESHSLEAETPEPRREGGTAAEELKDEEGGRSYRISRAESTGADYLLDANPTALMVSAKSVAIG